MKGIKLGLLAVTMAVFAACGEEQVDYDDNMTDSVATPRADNTNESIRGDGTQGNRTDDGMGATGAVTHAETSDPQSNKTVINAERGVSKTGQYNSNIVTPEPPNVRGGERRPEHTYGDTANRMDGANSVR